MSSIKFKYRDTFSLFKQTYNEWLDDKAFKMAAALSFYSLISLVPMLIIIIAITGTILGEEAAKGEIFIEIQKFVGPNSAKLIQELIVNASIPDSSILFSAISFGVLIWASVGVFVELRESLNWIWGVETKPGRSLKSFFKNRLFSFTVILVIGFLLILSLMSSAVLSAIDDYIGRLLSIKIPFIHLLDFGISFTIMIILFSFIFKYLPGVKVELKYVWKGAVFTSILFNIGKFAIGFYLGKTYYASIYGAAGSLVILLFWIYYSSLIFLFGAELIQVYRKRYSDTPLTPERDVLIIKKVTEMISGDER